MNQGDKPDLLIFHGPSCLAGLASVWAVHQKWPDVPVHMGVYGEPPPSVAGLRVLIADFSYPADVLTAMAEEAIEVTVLDHHESAREHVTALLQANVIKGVFDMTRSGAMLTWAYTWGSPHAPKLIEHVQDRDLWRFEIPNTREVCAVLQTYADDDWETMWTGIGRDLEGGRAGYVHDIGRGIVNSERANMAKVIAAGIHAMIIGGHTVPVVNAPYFWASDIAGDLAQGHPFAATYMDLPAGRQFSLRSAPTGADVQAVAKEYGGGGHVHAAGFTAPHGWTGDVDQAEGLESVPLNTGGKVTVAEG